MWVVSDDDVAAFTVIAKSPAAERRYRTFSRPDRALSTDAVVQALIDRYRLTAVLLNNSDIHCSQMDDGKNSARTRLTHAKFQREVFRLVKNSKPAMP